MRKCRSISHKTTYGMHLFLLAKRSFLGEERGVPRCASLASSPRNLFGLSLKPWGIALKFLFLHHENILFPND